MTWMTQDAQRIFSLWHDNERKGDGGWMMLLVFPNGLASFALAPQWERVACCSNSKGSQVDKFG